MEEKVNIHLGEHLDYKKIFKMTIFPIIMMVFISLYSVIDGIYISNFSNNDAFAAVNLIFPFIMVIGSIGFMLGTGGTALVSKYLGEKKEQKAKETFSLIVYVTIVLGIIFSIGGFFLVEPVVKLLASFSKDSTEAMVQYAVMYGRVML